MLARCVASFSSEAWTQRAACLVVVLGMALTACSQAQDDRSTPSVGLRAQFDAPTDPSLGGCDLGSAKLYSIGTPPPSSSADRGTPITSGQEDVDIACRVAGSGTPALYRVDASVYSPHIVFKLESSASGPQAPASLQVRVATVGLDLSTQNCTVDATSAPFVAAPGEIWGSFSCTNAVADGMALACNVAGLLWLTGCNP